MTWSLLLAFAPSRMQRSQDMFRKSTASSVSLCNHIDDAVLLRSFGLRARPCHGSSISLSSLSSCCPLALPCASLRFLALPWASLGFLGLPWASLGFLAESRSWAGPARSLEAPRGGRQREEAAACPARPGAIPGSPGSNTRTKTHAHLWHDATGNELASGKPTEAFGVATR